MCCYNQQQSTLYYHKFGSTCRTFSESSGSHLRQRICKGFEDLLPKGFGIAQTHKENNNINEFHIILLDRHMNCGHTKDQTNVIKALTFRKLQWLDNNLHIAVEFVFYSNSKKHFFSSSIINLNQRSRRRIMKSNWKISSFPIESLPLDIKWRVSIIIMTMNWDGNNNKIKKTKTSDCFLSRRRTVPECHLLRCMYLKNGNTEPWQK